MWLGTFLRTGAYCGSHICYAFWFLCLSVSECMKRQLRWNFLPNYITFALIVSTHIEEYRKFSMRLQQHSFSSIEPNAPFFCNFSEFVCCEVYRRINIKPCLDHAPYLQVNLGTYGEIKWARCRERNPSKSTVCRILVGKSVFWL